MAPDADLNEAYKIVEWMRMWETRIFYYNCSITCQETLQYAKPTRNLYQIQLSRNLVHGI